MPSAKNAIVVEVDPQTAFAPLKNALGAATDTLETVHAQMTALHRSWLREAGVTINDDVPSEISPLYALLMPSHWLPEAYRKRGQRELKTAKYFCK